MQLRSAPLIVIGLALVCGAGVAGAQQTTCPPVEVVFVMDTSDSMLDDAENLCQRIARVQADLAARGVVATPHFLGITETGYSGSPSGPFRCLTSHVRAALGATVPGTDTCGPTLDQFESWGPATAIVASRFEWMPGVIRLIVALSDEGPCRGEPPCANPGTDLDSILNAIDQSVANAVTASVITGRNSSTCTKELAKSLADGTGGTTFASEDPDEDIAVAIETLIEDACLRRRLQDVRVTDTVSTNGVTIDEQSFSTEPFAVVKRPEETDVEWRLGDVLVGQNPTLSFYVDLHDLVADERRLVNQRLAVEYLDGFGTPVRREIGPHFVTVLASAFTVDVSTDHATYGPTDVANVDATVTFGGLTATFADVTVSILDAGSQVVAELAVLPGEYFVPGEAKTYGPLPFATDGVLAGGYRAVVVLRTDGLESGRGEESFVVGPASGQPLVSSSVTTDKASYSSNEQVRIASRVTNESANRIFDGLDVELRVDGPSGRVADFTRRTETLVPGARSDASFSLETATLPAGQYAVSKMVREGVEVLAIASTSFSILSAPEAGVALTGVIKATPRELAPGEDLELDYSVTNVGNEPLTGVTLTQKIVDPDSEAVLRQFEKVVDFPIGEDFSQAFVVDEPNFPPHAYIALLQAEYSGKMVTLGWDGFTVGSLLGSVSDVHCYRASTSTKGAGPERKTVLTDRFQSVDGTVTKASMLCKAVGVNATTAPKPAPDLMCYQLRARGRVAEPTLTVRDRFGVQTLTVKRSPTVCAPARTDSAPVVPDRDFMTCYSVRPTEFASRDVSLVDGFAPHDTRLTTALRPVSLCVPTGRDGDPIRNARTFLTCYKIKAKARPRQTRLERFMASVTDVFGTTGVQLGSASRLCVVSSPANPPPP